MNNTTIFYRSSYKYNFTEIQIRYFALYRKINIDDHSFEAFNYTREKHPSKIFLRSRATAQWYAIITHFMYPDSMITCGIIGLELRYHELISDEIKERIELEKQRLSYGIMCLKFTATLIDDLIQLIAVIDY